MSNCNECGATKKVDPNVIHLSNLLRYESTREDGTGASFANVLDSLGDSVTYPGPGFPKTTEAQSQVMMDADYAYSEAIATAKKAFAMYCAGAGVPIKLCQEFAGERFWPNCEINEDDE